MSNESLSASVPPLSGLFQRAHSRMVVLQRVDEQIAALLEQRRKLQDELRDVQAQINEEFNQVLSDDPVSTQLAGEGKK